MQNCQRVCHSYPRSGGYGRSEASCSPPRCSSPSLCGDPTQISTLQNHVQCQRQHISTLDGKIKSLECELNKSQVKNSQCCNDIETMRRKVCQRDEALARQEYCIQELKCDLKNKENQVRCLQDKLCASENCSNQKDACLTSCESEVSQLTCQLNDLKAKMDCEINKRDTCISQMKEDLRRVCEELKEKKCHNAKLDESLCEVKGRYHQAVCSLKECDARVKCLNDKVVQLECQLKTNCVQYKKDIKELNDCACKASQEAKCLSEEVNRLKCALQEKANELEACCRDKDALCRDISCEREKVDSLKEQLKQKMCEVKELQQQLDCCTHDVERLCREAECCRKRLQEKQNEVALLCNKKRCVEDELANLQCRYDRDVCRLEEQIDQMEKDSCCLRTNLEDRDGKLFAVKDCIATTDCEIRRIVESAGNACTSDYCNSNVVGSEHVTNSIKKTSSKYGLGT